jgi:hypothetical protein
MAEVESTHESYAQSQKRLYHPRNGGQGHSSTDQLSLSRTSPGTGRRVNGSSIFTSGIDDGCRMTARNNPRERMA